MFDLKREYSVLSLVLSGVVIFMIIIFIGGTVHIWLDYLQDSHIEAGDP